MELIYVLDWSSFDGPDWCVFNFMIFIPVDQFRPYLNTYVPGTNDYINAVIIPVSLTFSPKHRPAFSIT